MKVKCSKCDNYIDEVDACYQLHLGFKNPTCYDCKKICQICGKKIEEKDEIYLGYPNRWNAMILHYSCWKTEADKILKDWI